MFNVLAKWDYAKNSEREIVKMVSSGEDVRLVDLNVVRENYRKLNEALPYAQAYAAVKANTSDGVLETIDKEGSQFEIATIEELRECVKRGIDAKKIIFTHPAKDAVEISEAYKAGVTRFTTDNEEDLSLIAEHAPKSKVMVRMKTANEDKDNDNLTGFNSRFGASEKNAKALLRSAKEQGLEAYGLAFHVGTQEENVHAWDSTIKTSAAIFKDMAAEGINLEVLDIGGGFPSRYKNDVPELKEYGQAIGESINEHFEGALPKEIFYEPGRSISAMAGVTIGRVVNVKQNEYDNKNIVTVSTGRFSAGLFNVGNGMMFFRKNKEGFAEKISDEISKKADVYGKACASFDKPIEGSDVYVPASLKSGDIVAFTGTGAYSKEMITNWCSKTPPTTITFDSGEKNSKDWSDRLISSGRRSLISK